MTDKEIIYYKDLYTGHKIIYVLFANREFLFRTLTRREYKTIISYAEGYEKEDEICQIGCIYPEPDKIDFSRFPMAGFVTKVAKVIEIASGFDDIKTVLNEYHEQSKISNMELNCMDLIKAFFPEYTYEEMDDWTWEKLIKTTVRAEAVAKMKGMDFHLVDQSDEVRADYEKISIRNKEFVEQLLEQGIDPMLYFQDSLTNGHMKDPVDKPLIGGLHWKNPDVLKLIQEQMWKRKQQQRR